MCLGKGSFNNNQTNEFAQREDRISAMKESHYGEEYFLWQSSIGEFGGWANKNKFSKFIKPGDRVLDYGCGGGYLLKHIICHEKIGVDINPTALLQAKINGMKIFEDVKDIPKGSIDVIISNHALEHVLNPLGELKKLYSVLKPGGQIVLVIPCETIHTKFTENDNNHHLFSWGALSLGNLFKSAGFSVIESKPYIHKWPPNYQRLAKIFGRKMFDLICKIYARIERSSFQIRIIGQKGNNI
jgi:SAM-dependent methyltransferase